MQFELFKMQRSRSGGTVKRVSLNTRGVFTINKLAFEALEKPEAVQLYYNEENKVIALKPVPKDEEFSYSVRKQGKNNSWLIGGKAFCTFYDIPTEKTVTFNKIELLEDGMMALDLKDTSEVSTGRKKKKQDSTQGSLIEE